MEWISDGYGPYEGNEPTSPKTRKAFGKRANWAVARGGSFAEKIYGARGANRRYFSAGHRGEDIGFRCVKVLP